MCDLISVFCISFILSVIKIPIIIEYCDWFELYDDLDFHRKCHGFGASRLGGVVIFSAFMLSMLLLLNVRDGEVGALLISTSVVFFIGLKDDILGGVLPGEKIQVQLLSAIILVFLGDYKITSMYGLLGVYELSELNAAILSIGIVVFVVNAFNFIDGIDGLAGTIGVIVNVSFGMLFLKLGNTTMAFAAFGMTGAIAGFLRYNFVSGTIFMGDAGSMVIGLVSISSAIKFLTLNDHNLSGATIIDVSPAIVLAILIVPVFDGIRVILLRLSASKSPFAGDRNHMHHKLKFLGFSDVTIVLILACFNVWILILALSLNFLNDVQLIGVLFCICIIFNVWITYAKGKRS
ncbi:MraY family glycosyltransferase [Pedobacter frigoris]|uniref:MraY family glycosyltransferase n=1 Tax=Pedobacter frigoris TaxID=2571272 RepID=UPI0029305F72|nr:MraY family glycosyltransferase [Pedobacter frigoris]